MKTEFVIVVVCLNPGEKLKGTLDSIFRQTYKDYRVIIKDGLSSDGALKQLEEEGYFENRPVEIIKKADKSIYDAMNQAVEYIKRPENEEKRILVQFLNCGDTFHSEDVLSKVADFVEKESALLADKGKSVQNTGLSIRQLSIFYGNSYNLKTDCLVTSSPRLSEFALYRNYPCHQTCFYDAELLDKRQDGSGPYIPEYRIRADYEHILYSVYEKKAATVYMDMTVCNYEGGGYSESKENKNKSKEEHAIITKKYMGSRAAKYRTILFLSGAGIRTRLAESKTFSGTYNWIKSAIYTRNR